VTSASGFLILFERLLPSHAVDAISLVVLVVQSFLKVPPLHLMAPNGSEPPFEPRPAVATF
jgi:hypothetical protein